MRILIYTHEFLPWGGGVATYNYELASGLSELGHEVVVLAPYYSDKDSVSDKELPFSVVRMSLPIGSVMQLDRNVSRLPGSTYRFLTTLRRYHPDRVLVTQATAHESAALARLLYRFRFTLTVYGTEIYWHFPRGRIGSWPKRHLMRWFFRKAESIICISRSTEDLLLQKASGLKKKTFVVYPGINPDVSSFPRRSQDLVERLKLSGQKIILTVARLSSGKGQDTVIKALPRVLERVPNAKYVIVGDGPERPELETLVENMRLRNSVLFVGHAERDDVESYFEMCDVFVMLSRKGNKEGFGLVYLEAWAHKKPVVGGNTGGVREVIEDGKTGFLVDATDTESAAKSISRILKNEDLAGSLGRAGRTKVENEFSRRQMVRKTLELM